MTAIRLLARAEVRRRLGSLATTTVLVAVVVGVVLAAVSGARRTDSALDRFYMATNAPSGMLGAFWPALGQDDEAIASIRERLLDSDGVDEVAVAQFVLADAETALDFGVFTGPDDAYLRIGRPIEIDGRAPEQSAPNEVALTERTAAELDLGPGDILTISTVSPETAAGVFENTTAFELDGPVIDLRVVGVVRDVDDLRPDGQTSSPFAYVSPAFSDAYPNAARVGANFLIVGDEATMDTGHLLDIVRSELPPASGAEIYGGIGHDDESLRSSYRTLANGLRVFALLAGLTGLVAVWLTITRHMQQARADGRVLAEIGMSAREIATGWSVPLIVACGVGVVLGSIGSTLASPLFPLSLARRAEPDPGIRIDPTTTAVGATVALILLVGVVAFLSSRSASQLIERAGAASALTSRGHVPRTSSGRPVDIGRSLVLGARRNDLDNAPWAAVGGAVLAVSGVIGIAAFISSQEAVASDPGRFGMEWTIQPDVLPNELDEPIDAFVERLARDDRVEAVGGLFCELGGAFDDDSAVCAMRVAKGSMAPVITAGRAPASPDEIALGELSADRLGVAIGDEVLLPGNGAGFQVVGTSVMPTIDTDRPGLGAYVTQDGLMRMMGTSDIYDGTVARLLLRYPADADPAAVSAGLASDFPALDFSPYSLPEPPELVLQLGRLQPMLIVLGAFVGLVAAIGTLHYLTLSTRRRRRQTGALRALGYVRRQIWSIVAWQAVTVAAIGVVVGIPLGLVVGRWTWTTMVADLGIVDTPSTPWLALLMTPVVFVVGGLVLSSYPAWRATKTRPAEALRAE